MSETSFNDPHQPHTLTKRDLEVPELDLGSPWKVRGITFRNRIAMSPMCQFSSVDGFADDWHLVHLGSRAVGGSALILVEATAVTPEGRISPSDLGIWKDEHIPALKRIAHFIRSQGAVAGIQLAHAGRKASCNEPWKGDDPIPPKDGGWNVIAPSPIPFLKAGPVPKELDHAGIRGVIHAFEEAAKRAVQAGFQVIEIHAAHGYLLHEFLSPLSNQRKDEYGGSLENRMRIVLEIASSLRKIVPQEHLLIVRLSATDWHEGGWDVEQSVELSRHLKERGVDLIDVSTGALLPVAQIPVSKGYQVPFAQKIRDKASIPTGAVGLITDPQHANEIITTGSADMVFVGRELLRDPYWAIRAQHELEIDPSWPLQYGYAVKRKK